MGKIGENHHCHLCQGTGSKRKAKHLGMCPKHQEYCTIHTDYWKVSQPKIDRHGELLDITKLLHRAVSYKDESCSLCDLAADREDKEMRKKKEAEAAAIKAQEQNAFFEVSSKVRKPKKDDKHKKDGKGADRGSATNTGHSSAASATS
ncbi:hypothetical protein LTR86_002313 [Recurvomyces mirabilis]|nr:hypothetical protein LTR86_002313 [Recurvomyces mirabilis]